MKNRQVEKNEHWTTTGFQILHRKVISLEQKNDKEDHLSDYKTITSNIYSFFSYTQAFIIQNQYILADVRKSTCVDIRFPNVSVGEASLSYVLLFLTVYLN